MFNTLFRDEALSSTRREILGEVSFQAPRLGWLFFLLGIFVTVAAICILCFGRYTRRERVEGTLVPHGGILTMTSSEAGIVWRVFVKENQSVRAGQPLVEISVAQIGARTGNAQASIAEHLSSKLNGLSDDLASQQRAANIEREGLLSRLELLRSQALQVEEQVAIQRQRAAEEKHLYEEWKQASLTGVVSRAQLLNQHDQALQSLAQVASLKAQEMDLKRQVQQIKESVERLPIETAIKRNQTQRQVDDVAQAQVENEARRSIMITAPCAGVVTNVLVNEGQALDARQSVVTVLQRHVVLQAELWMSTSAIGFVHEGQLVILRYRAFPYQKFGEYYGRVNEVSRSAVFPNEVSKITGRISDQSSYRVEVTLDSQDVDIYGKRERLKPGMELEADVLLERQRLIAWMFEPLFAVSGGTSLEKTTGRAQP